MKTGITKDVLVKVADELNSVMGLDPKIETGDKVTKDDITAEITEVAVELTATDSVSEETRNVLGLLGIELPKFEEKPARKTRQKKERKPVEKSVFGHRVGTMSGAIDEMLIKGMKMKTMVNRLMKDFKREEKPAQNKITAHIKHLGEIGVEVKENDKGTFSAQAPAVEEKPEEKPEKKAEEKPAKKAA